MKTALKILGIFLCSFLVSAIIYPAIHESGHCFAAFAVGAKVVAVSIFPAPCVTCDVLNVPPSLQAVIATGGIFLPIILCLTDFVYGFWCWYGFFVFKIVTVFYSVFFVFSALWSMLGFSLKNNDAAFISELWSGGAVFIIALLTASIFVILIRIIKERPIKRLYAYFGISD